MTSEHEFSEPRVTKKKDLKEYRCIAEISSLVDIIEVIIIKTLS